MMMIWKCSIPLKVKIFMWMAAHDRIQCAVQLKNKQWSGAEECFTCGKLESSDHILFQCPIVVFLWFFMRDFWDGRHPQLAVTLSFERSWKDVEVKSRG
jgi:hypothetical protein